MCFLYCFNYALFELNQITNIEFSLFFPSERYNAIFSMKYVSTLVALTNYVLILFTKDEHTVLHVCVCVSFKHL